MGTTMVYLFNRAAIGIYSGVFPGTKYQGVGSGTKVWSEYKEEIMKALMKKCKNRKLQNQREQVAKYIWDEHFKKFPKWPTVDEHYQKEVIDVEMTDVDKGDGICVWNASGMMSVEDTRIGPNEFKAECQGEVDFYAVWTNNATMTSVEDEIRSKGSTQALEDWRPKVQKKLADSSDKMMD